MHENFLTSQFRQEQVRTKSRIQEAGLGNVGCISITLRQSIDRYTTEKNLIMSFAFIDFMLRGLVEVSKAHVEDFRVFFVSGSTM